MPRKYLYLDDEEPYLVRPYAREVEKYEEDLTISLMHPKQYGEQMKKLVRDDFDGLILDLRLDMYPDKQVKEATKKADYRAPHLPKRSVLGPQRSQSPDDGNILLYSGLQRSYSMSLIIGTTRVMIYLISCVSRKTS